MGVTLTSISPLSGPPRTVVTCLGTGFDAGSQVCCPSAVETTLVDAVTLTAAIPDLAGPGGGSMQVGVFVMGADGSTSGVQLFTVEFPPVQQQGWTTVDQVASEIPGFARNGKIKDADILNWITSIAQTIAGVMLRRGLSVNPADWPAAGVNGGPSPASCLEMINRMGAGEAVAAAQSALFGAAADWPVTKRLRAAYAAEMQSLRNGEYDHLFKASAATVESGPLLSASAPECPAFKKEQVF